MKTYVGSKLVDDSVRITKETKMWDNDVRQFCIRHRFYTAGCCEDYQRMLRMVNMYSDNPTDLQLYEIAKDIYDHSVDAGCVSYVMGLIAKECMNTFYAIEQI